MTFIALSEMSNSSIPLDDMTDEQLKTFDTEIMDIFKFKGLQATS